MPQQHVTEDQTALPRRSKSLWQLTLELVENVDSDLKSDMATLNEIRLMQLKRWVDDPQSAPAEMRNMVERARKKALQTGVVKLPSELRAVPRRSRDFMVALVKLKGGDLSKSRDAIASESLENIAAKMGVCTDTAERAQRDLKDSARLFVHRNRHHGRGHPTNSYRVGWQRYETTAHRLSQQHQRLLKFAAGQDDRTPATNPQNATTNPHSATTNPHNATTNPHSAERSTLYPAHARNQETKPDNKQRNQQPTEGLGFSKRKICWGRSITVAQLRNVSQREELYHIFITQTGYRHSEDLQQNFHALAINVAYTRSSDDPPAVFASILNQAPKDLDARFATTPYRDFEVAVDELREFQECRLRRQSAELQARANARTLRTPLDELRAAEKT